MNNAIQIFDSLNTYNDILNLIGVQENIFLDFKTTKSEKGVLLEDDRKNFAKAASGFAHQEGGVIVWGIDARKDNSGIDQAKNLVPIPNVKQFLNSLMSFDKLATEPMLDGIKHKIVYNADNNESNLGFVISIFPQSSREHQVINSNSFYKRQGDSFVPLSTSDIKSLFIRTLAPDLWLSVTKSENNNPPYASDLTLFLSLENRGKGMAKYAQILIGFEPNLLPTVYDSTGNSNFRNLHFGYNVEGEYTLRFNITSDIVIHAGALMTICRLIFSRVTPKKFKIKYKLFAENMMPIIDEFEVEHNLQ